KNLSRAEETVQHQKPGRPKQMCQERPDTQASREIKFWTQSCSTNETLTQNPKTDTEEIRGKLEQKSWKGNEDHAQEGTHGGADRSGFAAGGSGSEGSGDLPQGGDQPGDVLPVEATVFGCRGERAA